MLKGFTGQLAEAGKIKIGKKGELRKYQSGAMGRPPIKLDHFLITINTRGQDDNLILDTNLMGAIKPDADSKIRAVPIMLHADTIDGVFPTRYALYTGKSCVCSGDGERATRTLKDESIKEMRCPCEFLPEPLGLGDPTEPPKIRCKPNGKLLCSIVAPGQAVAGAVHTWRTTSEISIKRMYGSLEQILSVVGALRGVPLWLRLEPVKVDPIGGKPSTVYCCHVELRETDIAIVQSRALEAAERRRALGGGDGYRKLLTAPAVGESPDEQQEIAEEFYPEVPPEDVEGPIENAGDALADRIAGNGEQAPPGPDPKKFPGPDPKKSGVLTSKILEVIGGATSIKELGDVLANAKKQRSRLIETDIEIIKREYAARHNQLAAVARKTEPAQAKIERVIKITDLEKLTAERQSEVRTTVLTVIEKRIAILEAEKRQGEAIDPKTQGEAIDPKTGEVTNEEIDFGGPEESSPPSQTGDDVPW